jgi:hypothetical protein
MRTLVGNAAVRHPVACSSPNLLRRRSACAPSRSTHLDGSEIFLCAVIGLARPSSLGAPSRCTSQARSRRGCGVCSPFRSSALG